MRVVIGIIAMIVIAACQDARDDHMQIAEMSNRALSCAALATASNRIDETQRLHELGMLLARQYLAAARAGELTERERSNAPDPWKMLGPPDQRGPSDQAILGTVQRVALQRAIDSLKALPGSDAERLAAAEEFAKARCESVGR